MPVTDRMYSNTLAPVVLTIIVIVLGYYSVNEYNESAQITQQMEKLEKEKTESLTSKELCANKVQQLKSQIQTLTEESKKLNDEHNDVTGKVNKCQEDVQAINEKLGNNAKPRQA